ncbi:MAG TPA: SMP-30/gluconolactonase/LRE family protein [Bryobacteraceae bacterium]|nr:SMP-30/gluconolactonase/LRE family protein [Bryobacteraceae bacterium]
MRITRRQFAVSAVGSMSGLMLAQEDTGPLIERVAAGFRFTEGPAWSREGFLLFSDIPNDRIMKYMPGEKPTVLRENSNGAVGNAFDAQGRFYTCESRTRRVMRMDKKGEIQVLADKWEGKRFNAPNDIVVRHDGHAYFTDPAFGAQADTRELDFFGVYHVAPKGELRLIAKPEGRPNGVAFSPNGHVLYITNSDEHNVRAYDVDHNGDVSNERVLISGVEGVPDGARVDEKGNLYVTGTRVWIYDTQGKLIGNLDLPETPSNCAFGDSDLRTLYITARTGLYRSRREVKGALQY